MSHVLATKRGRAIFANALRALADRIESNDGDWLTELVTLLSQPSADDAPAVADAQGPDKTVPVRRDKMARHPTDTAVIAADHGGFFYEAHWNEIKSFLETCNDRDEALGRLTEMLDTKKKAEQFARLLDISGTKSTPLDRLRERIIERTVGARLRSRAIQGDGNTVL